MNFVYIRTYIIDLLGDDGEIGCVAYWIRLGIVVVEVRC